MIAAEAMRNPSTVALAEKLGHGGGLQALRDLTRTRTKHPPCPAANQEGHCPMPIQNAAKPYFQPN